MALNWRSSFSPSFFCCLCTGGSSYWAASSDTSADAAVHDALSHPAAPAVPANGPHDAGADAGYFPPRWRATRAVRESARATAPTWRPVPATAAAIPGGLQSAHLAEHYAAYHVLPPASPPAWSTATCAGYYA